jgi:hypothetical protein
MKKFNLNYGCFDFIYTPDDNYVFLECNAIGAYGWIEVLTGMPITECIIKKIKEFMCTPVK